MVKRPKIKKESEALEGKVLCYLHYLYAHENKNCYSFETIKNALPNTPQGIVSYALREPINNKLINVDEAGYSITENGVDWVEALNEETYKEMTDGIIFPENENSSSSEEQHPTTDIGVPASDRIVTLDHNSADYRETVAALKLVSEEVRKSNEFANLFADPDDRIRVSSEINGGIELFKNVRVNVDHVKNLLIPNLKLIAQKLADASIGALAIKALEWLTKLFGL